MIHLTNIQILYFHYSDFIGKFYILYYLIIIIFFSMFFYIFVIIGIVSFELCSLTKLTTLYIENTGLTCYPSCFNTVSSFNRG